MTDAREPSTILVFSASLRAESLNTRLSRLTAAAIGRPDGVHPPGCRDLTYQRSTVGLDIVDDGGFDPEGAGRRGFGLTSMQSRTQQLGRMLQIDSTSPACSATRSSTVTASPRLRVAAPLGVGRRL